MNLYKLYWIILVLCTLQSSIAQIDVGTTGASLDVSSTGALTYSIPVALPPGVNNLVPKVSLAYNSQTGNGIAGWGWNINGISTISRVGTTLANDGFINGVDFQLDDRFALDGERLILASGSYGAPNSVYRTENHSHLKIIAFGTSTNGSNSGPKFFKVFHPDGSIATYRNVIKGQTYNNEVAEWVIHQMEDPFGNRIQYHYHETTSKVIYRIKKIEYAGPTFQSTGHPNVIQFQYKIRKRPETSYVPGRLKSTRAHILSGIEVYTNGKVYRKYHIFHKSLKNGYELIDRVQESNSTGRKLTPIKFTYPVETTHDLEGCRKIIKVNQNFKSKKRVISGDFDGDAHLDFVVYDDDDRTYFSNHLKSKGYKQPVRTNTPKKFGSVHAATLKTGSNTISQKQHLLTMVGIKGGKYFFRGYLSDNQGTFKSRYYRNYVDQKLVNKPFVAKVLVVGNFLGNGMSSGLFLQRRSKHVVFADFNKEVSSNTNIPFVQSGNLLTSFNSDTSFVRAADYDGDGKDELWHFQNNALHIYTLNRQLKLSLVVKFTNDEGRLTVDRQILMGDYNGDGKADLLIPQINGTKWLYLYARGNHFTSTTAGAKLPFRKVFADFQQLKYVKDTKNKKTYYVSQDFDGDGKADIIRHTLEKKNQTVQLFINEGVDGKVMKLVSSAKGTINVSTTSDQFNAIPILLDVNLKNPNHEYVFAHDNVLESFSLTKDHRKDVRIIKVKNNLLSHHITYDNLDSGNNTYTARVGNTYPFVHINASPGVPLVKKLIEKGSGITRTRDFKYEGAITHALGYGFIGFRFLKSTDWYGANTPVIWNVSDFYMDHRRGALNQSWRALDYSNSPSNAIVHLKYQYETKTVDGIFINKLKKITTKDELLGFTSTETIRYDEVYNPIRIEVRNPSSKKVTTYTYANKFSATNHTYHMGRKLSKHIVNTKSNSTKKHTEVFSYYPHGKLKVNKSNHNGVASIEESFQYDAFGNIIQKNTKAPGHTQRSEKFKYTSDGRFMISKTAIDGTKTTFLFDQNTGNPISSTDHLGRKISTKYDGWGRALSETNYLGHKTTYTYEKLPNFIRHRIKTADGSQSFRDINAFGLEQRTATRSFDGSWIWKLTHYDASGRKWRYCEPRYDSDPKQWNTNTYDSYGRLIRLKSYTGQVVTTSYAGLSTTTTDGTQTKVTVKDHDGLIASLTDQGGTVYFKYNADGQVVLSDYDGYKIRTSYDALGRKQKVNDPSAGAYAYTYNGFDQLLTETSPKGKLLIHMMLQENK